MGQKLNYSQFKHINLVGPSERIIKQGKSHTRLRGTKTRLCGCFEDVKKPIDPQFTHQTATVHYWDYLHYRLINQSHREISICITKCTVSARSKARV